mmetsp:Transcript_54974/g.174826  ORF Transcript_54974/g.174826 Transcript_54974/m.174826 type:complete len:157 (-) Transcript_54974:900-1370(-)
MAEASTSHAAAAAPRFDAAAFAKRCYISEAQQEALDSIPGWESDEDGMLDETPSEMQRPAGTSQIHNSNMTQSGSAAVRPLPRSLTAMPALHAEGSAHFQRPRVKDAELFSVVSAFFQRCTVPQVDGLNQALRSLRPLFRPSYTLRPPPCSNPTAR